MRIKTREEIKAILLEKIPNFCNELRESDWEYKNYTDEECLDWWVLGIETALNGLEGKKIVDISTIVSGGE